MIPVALTSVVLIALALIAAYDELYERVMRWIRRLR